MSKKTWMEVIPKDMDSKDLNEDMLLNRNV